MIECFHTPWRIFFNGNYFLAQSLESEININHMLERGYRRSNRTK